jgi:hypothetical protein
MTSQPVASTAMTDRGSPTPAPSLPAIRGPGLVPPMHRPLDTDAIPEFHAARLLILLATCGDGSPRRITGRTKLAKLDFFLRYPRFLARALDVLRSEGANTRDYVAPVAEAEAPMIRYRYGPWDPRYGDFVALLEARGLVRVTGARVDSVALTASGSRVARQLMARDEFAELRQRGEAISSVLATWSGTALKDFVYELFPREVGSRRMRERIEP